ncbi:alpha/beta fold hydrolase [Streptomyces badius]
MSGGGAGPSGRAFATRSDTAGWLMPVSRAVLSWVQPRPANNVIIGAFDPAATRAGLAGFEGSALLLAGEFDRNSPPRAVAACAELFRRGAFVEQPGAGHCPWGDDPDRFVVTVASFLV